MKPLLLVAGLAVALALVSGALLLTARPAAGPADSGRESPGPAGAREDITAPAVPRAWERRVESLEVRLEEMQARLDRLQVAAVPGAGGSGYASMGDSLGGVLPGESPGDAEEGDREDPDGPGPADGPTSSEREVMRGLGADLRAARESLAQIRRETEIRRKVDSAATVMHLQPAEKDALEEIVRNHVTRVEELGGRARQLLKESPFGLTPADRSVLDQLQGDRKTLDRDTEQALTNLLGAQRLKTYRKAEKDQRDKERTLRRLGSPW